VNAKYKDLLYFAYALSCICIRMCQCHTFFQLLVIQRTYEATFWFILLEEICLLFTDC